MTNFVYQYHVYNEHISLIVSVPIKEDDYAINFAKRVAKDFYDYTEEQLNNIQCEFIVMFFTESVINVKKLNQ